MKIIQLKDHPLNLNQIKSPEQMTNAELMGNIDNLKCQNEIFKRFGMNCAHDSKMASETMVSMQKRFKEEDEAQKTIE